MSESDGNTKLNEGDVVDKGDLLCVTFRILREGSGGVRREGLVTSLVTCEFFRFIL